MRWAIEKGLNDQHVYHRKEKSKRPKKTYKDKWYNQRDQTYYDGNERCSLYVPGPIPATNVLIDGLPAL